MVLCKACDRYLTLLRDDGQHHDQIGYAIAKVAYEWHCYINDVEEYQEDAHGLITSYIIEPEHQMHWLV